MKCGNNRIDTVLFDFGGVIAEEGFIKGFKAIALKNGLDEDDCVRTASYVIHSSGYLYGNAPESVFWDSFRKVTEVKGDDESLRNEILSRFEIRDWIIDLVEKLKGMKIRVGILSDQTDWLDILNERYDFFRWFDIVYNSYHMGKGKIDPGIFDDVIRLLDVPASRILFIDDRHGNCERAAQKGLKVIYYKSRAEFLVEISRFIPLQLSL